MIGSIVIDEQVIPILALDLIGGELVVKAGVDVEAGRSTYSFQMAGQPYRVHGADGSLIATGKLTAPELPDRVTVTSNTAYTFTVHWDVSSVVDVDA